MKLTITTPLAVVVDADNIAALRAEDETGAFGLLPGHADFLTVLAISVVSWRAGDGKEMHAAVHGGMLEARGGTAIAIATREAVTGSDLHVLETEVLTRFRQRLAEEQAARQDAERLYLAAIRQICRFVRPGTYARGPLAPLSGWPEAPEALSGDA